MRRADDLHPFHSVDLCNDIDGVVLIADHIHHDLEVVFCGLQEVAVASRGVELEVIFVDLPERAGQALQGARVAVFTGFAAGGEPDVELDLLVVAVPHPDVGDVAAL